MMAESQSQAESQEHSQDGPLLFLERRKKKIWYKIKIKSTVNSTYKEIWCNFFFLDTRNNICRHLCVFYTENSSDYQTPVFI